MAGKNPQPRADGQLAIGARRTRTRRHDAMLEFLREPHSIDDMRAHRFIYRPHVEMPFVESVERRSAELHVQRMLRRGEAAEVAPGRFQSTP